MVIEEGEPRRRTSRKDAWGRALPPVYTHKACRRAPTTVPFIASWSGEKTDDPPVVYRLTGGIGYSGEVVSDRDSRGVLWLRRPSRPGVGKPLYGVVHPARQRLAMAQMLCQVCGHPATFDGGALWLLEDHRADWSGWPTGLVTTHPPICLPCVKKSREQCPHLWKGSVLARVGRSVPCGVWGRRYTASRSGPLPVASEVTAFESPLLGWTVASQSVRALYDCRITSLDEESARLSTSA
ncbi:hypothetical protein [Streptomyces sp. BBFR115]|uniref:hypothetical protein n=1 Tax=Streptomyces sp. BBFR115 TaxID=3448173 RepID=UPI003F774E42